MCQERLLLGGYTDHPKRNPLFYKHLAFNISNDLSLQTAFIGLEETLIPRDLPEDTDERQVAMNEKAKEYWNGKGGKGGHVFWAMPQELTEAIKQMDEHGLDTTEAKKKTGRFSKKSDFSRCFS